MKFKEKQHFIFLLINFLVCSTFGKNYFIEPKENGPIKVSVVPTENGFKLLRNGQPYYVKGAGGNTKLDVVMRCGGNSIRTWGLENAKQILDDAQKHGLTVMLGLWLQHERHGFDYDNSSKVKQQLEYFKNAIVQFKDHPALLMWGIGNEVDLDYSNVKVWSAVQDIAKYIHSVDPNHPTSTVTAGLDSSEVYWIKKLAPDIDIYCVNTYGDIGNVPSNIKKYGWNGPYMITEWGPNGHWESPTTSWNAALEQSSSEKASVYSERYKKYIEPNSNYCLGSYVFLWGQKQEYTLTWYGLFDANGLETEAVDALQLAWSGNPPQSSTPHLKQFTLNQKFAYQNIQIKSDELNEAKVQIDLLTYPNTQKDSQNINYEWKIIKESTDKKSGGDVEDAAEEVLGLFKNIKSTSKSVVFKSPSEIGYYRLFVWARYQNKIAYANIPFEVIPSTNLIQPKPIRFKTYDMNSFKDQ